MLAHFGCALFLFLCHYFHLAYGTKSCALGSAVPLLLPPNMTGQINNTSLSFWRVGSFCVTACFANVCCNPMKTSRCGEAGNKQCYENDCGAANALQFGPRWTSHSAPLALALGRSLFQHHFTCEIDLLSWPAKWQQHLWRIYFTALWFGNWMNVRLKLCKVNGDFDSEHIVWVI